MTDEHIDDVIVRFAGSHRNDGMYTYDDVCNCIRAALSIAPQTDQEKTRTDALALLMERDAWKNAMQGLCRDWFTTPDAAAAHLRARLHPERHAQESAVSDRMRWALKDFYRDVRHIAPDNRITEAFTQAVSRYFVSPQITKDEVHPKVLIPTGWALVPIEPTDAMRKAAREAGAEGYFSMIDAAPKENKVSEDCGCATNEACKMKKDGS